LLADKGLEAELFISLNGVSSGRAVLTSRFSEHKIETLTNWKKGRNEVVLQLRPEGIFDFDHFLLISKSLTH
jgi:hypothetical protein